MTEKQHSKQCGNRSTHTGKKEYYKSLRTAHKTTKQQAYHKTNPRKNQKKKGIMFVFITLHWTIISMGAWGASSCLPWQELCFSGWRLMSSKMDVAQIAPQALNRDCKFRVAGKITLSLSRTKKNLSLSHSPWKWQDKEQVLNYVDHTGNYFYP